MREEMKENMELMRKINKKYCESKGIDRFVAQYGVMSMINRNIKAMLLLLEDNVDKTK